MMDSPIDLRSDTVTQPSPEMRRVMADAEVGDDVYGEDPTVNRLQAYAAELLDKEAALLLPTGTMANLTAFLAQTRPGDAVILSESAHPVHYESGNLAMVGGLTTRLIADDFGKLSEEEVAAAIVQTLDPHYTPTTLIAIENTTNRGGGAYYQHYEIEAIARTGHGRGLRLHCDGARFFNACIAANMEPEFLARNCDTLSFCLSKGLGAPAGSVLTGDRETIARALRFRKMLGGGMRQVGVLAAAGIYALEHHRADLEEDHRRARTFRRALENEGIGFPLPSPTNIVYLETAGAAAKVAALAAIGIRALATTPDRIRVVFHRDISDAALTQSIDAFKKILLAH